MTSGSGWLTLDAGARVQCPRRGDNVELARCLDCNWLLDLDRAAGSPALRCNAAASVADGRERPEADRHVD